MRGEAARSLLSSLTCGRHSHSRCSSLPRCHPTQGCSEAASLPQLGTCPLPLPTDRVPLGAWSVPAALTFQRHRAGQPDKPVSPPACGGPRSSHSSVRLLRRRGPRGGGAGSGCPMADTPPRTPRRPAAAPSTGRGLSSVEPAGSAPAPSPSTSSSPCGGSESWVAGVGRARRGHPLGPSAAPSPSRPERPSLGPRLQQALWPPVREHTRTPSVLPGSCRTVTTPPPGSSTCS